MFMRFRWWLARRIMPYRCVALNLCIHGSLYPNVEPFMVEGCSFHDADYVSAVPPSHGPNEPAPAAGP